MFLDNNTSTSADMIKKEVPGLYDVAPDLANTLREGRFFLDKLFDICTKKNKNIDLTSEEQDEISLKVALVKNPEQVIQYARIVQMVFQLNYFSKCYIKALSCNELPKVIIKEAKTLLKDIERFRKMIEEEYVTKLD